jgi:catechol 2,3-dioxygenase-like lactoylglutathione lyase family enzyme
MATLYGHTNIIAADWRTLADFYCRYFDCVPVPPERNLAGDIIERGTGVPGAHLRGMHLRLPGHGPGGPTLEIYSYPQMEEKGLPAVANRKGFGHIAFGVDDVAAKVAEVLAAGGRLLGEIVDLPVAGAGTVTFAYVTDPEENVIEIQAWR